MAAGYAPEELAEATSICKASRPPFPAAWIASIMELLLLGSYCAGTYKYPSRPLLARPSFTMPFGAASKPLLCRLHTTGSYNYMPCV